MKHVQVLARMFFRAFVVAMLILIWDNKAIYGLPVGLLVGMLSEAEFLTKKRN